MATQKQELGRDLKELLRLLKETGVEFMVVGGYAVSFHGYPRFTKDLDVWLRLSEENSERVVRALHKFGFDFPFIVPEKFRDPLRVCRIGIPPNQIDFLAELAACDFDECSPRSASFMIDDIAIPFISKEDLITNKLAAGRPRDIADAHELKNI